ncbi:unnamed protein product [Rotaria sp. Silwood1]|nr:unnamed protein product [Rotaria sp. Silwood1]
MHAEYDRLRLQACMLLGVLLDDETMRQLKIPGDELTDLYFDAIRQAHQSSNKCYKRVPIHLLFRALSSLVHNEIIQTKMVRVTCTKLDGIGNDYPKSSTKAQTVKKKVNFETTASN